MEVWSLTFWVPHLLQKHILHFIVGKRRLSDTSSVVCYLTGLMHHWIYQSRRIKERQLHVFPIPPISTLSWGSMSVWSGEMCSLDQRRLFHDLPAGVVFEHRSLDTQSADQTAPRPESTSPSRFRDKLYKLCLSYSNDAQISCLLVQINCTSNQILHNHLKDQRNY